jgi:hypothetical protein
MKIALIGSAPSSIRLAPFHDPSWKIWGCSPGAYPILATNRVDAFFEMHRWEPPVIGNAAKQVPWFSPEYVEWLKQLKVPVYTGGPVADIPHHVVYPAEQMVKMFGPYFFTSSLAWMLALALCLDDVEEIGLWGVDMAATEEYATQRPGCHYFLTLAMQRGIKVTVPPESDLLMPPMLYGVGEWSSRMIKLTARRNELLGRKQAADQQAQAARDQSLFLSGALDDMNYMLTTWMEPEPPQVEQLVRDEKVQ